MSFSSSVHHSIQVIETVCHFQVAVFCQNTDEEDDARGRASEEEIELSSFGIYCILKRLLNFLCIASPDCFGFMCEKLFSQTDYSLFHFTAIDVSFPVFLLVQVSQRLIRYCDNGPQRCKHARRVFSGRCQLVILSMV
jgi:hypothetical protein